MSFRSTCSHLIGTKGKWDDPVNACPFETFVPVSDEQTTPFCANKTWERMV